ncbi:Biphenyl dioxygenase subunit beta [Nonomuraea coxensis DSM 45129]|uniref:Biphenyl dioxygenase subunit beta n=1 Tax=Nonomuraea coxensis DSM 45129 TaxID=1122611 RepID=A0ABX8U227_9ACTN|nr:aromatic-ring-hydroxylating dioxygenase subunit beta [Nonomuraea coxensis]QYC41800.1 Biphenyl dioxygenase subunit beta [Nonomuraea coxensis DSM 45129]
MSGVAGHIGLDVREAERFLYREARLADEHDYDGWEALWTDDALYWVPAGGDDTDPERQMSVIYDNRHRIATRIKQLKTGKRYAQSPPSNLRRLISNVEIVTVEGTDTVVGANFLIVESRERGTTMWAGRATYRLRRAGDDIRLAYKKVVLVDSAQALFTLAFLI